MNQTDIVPGVNMSKRIVVLGGDGVGPEVTDVACKILESMELGFEILRPHSGESAIKKYGTSFPDHHPTALST